MDGRLEIPDTLYRSIFEDEVTFGITELGLWVNDARNRAANIVQNCYVSRTTALQCDTQKDYDDEREGDWTR